MCVLVIGVCAFLLCHSVAAFQSPSGALRSYVFSAPSWRRKPREKLGGHNNVPASTLFISARRGPPISFHSGHPSSDSLEWDFFLQEFGAIQEKLMDGQEEAVLDPSHTFSETTLHSSEAVTSPDGTSTARGGVSSGGVVVMRRRPGSSRFFPGLKRFRRETLGNIMGVFKAMNEETPETGRQRAHDDYARVLYNFMIHGKFVLACTLLDRMTEVGVTPDVQDFAITLEACRQGGAWEKAVNVLDQMKRLGVPRTADHFLSALRAVAASRNPAAGPAAVTLLRKMEAALGQQPSSAAYTASIYAQRTAPDGAERAKMLLSEYTGLCSDQKAPRAPSRGAFIGLISVLRAQGRPSAEAVAVLEDLKSRVMQPDADTYTAAIAVCADRGDASTAMSLLDRMAHEGVSPTGLTYSWAIVACANAVCGPLSQRGNAPSSHEGLEGQEKESADGSFSANAFVLFQRMQREGHKRTTLAYHALLRICAERGLGGRALLLIRELRGGGPGGLGITRETLVLAMKACSRGGKQDEVWQIFLEMEARRMYKGDAVWDLILRSAQSRPQTNNVGTLSVLKKRRALEQKEESGQAEGVGGLPQDLWRGFGSLWGVGKKVERQEEGRESSAANSAAAMVAADSVSVNARRSEASDEAPLAASENPFPVSESDCQSKSNNPDDDDAEDGENSADGAPFKKTFSRFYSGGQTLDSFRQSPRMGRRPRDKRKGGETSDTPPR
uniref:Pentacotripeptide-repeat region of PRORP domain-containing protein n=1 Tax=Chromera velia CCMP2878 TaxID=1169474 RepID=A0A0G4EZ56_9ALVE|mmetsp:Transcript_54720/g.107054  ORF Transcript_54720/g.107054 Transcript_54720/m.107054 type:complete len:727 (+) Transcript_54720:219-2399(+)|eukprot:Cvel_14241.t1-p1 / transcript=Cvel_14241.t1 / gene=Cvel_14241 / organism=Chromera_velia_CCMP2878 / gene_product=Pentatricopeptide repeat-containing protein, putative / transcript_product=Pentatricopeptide repeat-containing protein, putative / location=Cvel_scaffold1005:20601-23678(-) / protein_length=726 / sequence_SO=supercontig / SO=protein_coding / is_pseudo=false